MDPKEFTEKMMDIAKLNERDEETSHVAADSLMCEVLTELGYGAGVDIFNEMCLWYA